MKPKKESNLIEEEIKKVLDSKIRPAVAKDGGDIKFISFQEGTVKVELEEVVLVVQVLSLLLKMEFKIYYVIT